MFSSGPIYQRHTNKHILEIDLDSHESARTILTARRATTSGFDHRSQAAQVENLGIAASVLHSSGDEDQSGLRVIKKSAEVQSTSSKERWSHLATDSIAFEQFKTHALHVTLQHHIECVPVVMYLLDHIKNRFEHSSAYGSYIEPGTVFRCDGTSIKHRDIPDVSATFLSFPYFDIGYGSPSEAPRDRSLHLIRPLFQQHYPNESTKDRDNNQQFRGFQRDEQVRTYLQVPQFWALILNSATMITCGPAPIADLFPDTIHIVSEDSLLSNRQCLVHVTDFHKRVTFLNPEQCGTYFELERTIQRECLTKAKEDLTNYLLYLGDTETTIEPGLWPALLAGTSTAFLYIRIGRKDRTALATATDWQMQRVEAPEKRKMIEYSGLESDDDSGGTMELGVRTSVLQREQPKSQTLSSNAVDAQARLESEGYFINQPDTLDDTRSIVFDGENPKIFRRPTMVELSARDAGANKTSAIDETGQESDASDISSTRSSRTAESTETYPGNEGVESKQRDGSSHRKKPVRFLYVEPDDKSKSEPTGLSHISPAENNSAGDTTADAAFPHHDELDSESDSESDSGSESDSEFDSGSELEVKMDAEELRQMIKEEIAAAFAKNEEKFQEHHEEKMRSKLAQSGFQKDQIEALMQIPLPKTMQETKQPTFPQISRKHLDVETLDYYNLPYKFDENLDYIIVLREMSIKETNVLFEHTRRLRSEPPRRQDSSQERRPPHSINKRDEVHMPTSIDVSKMSKRGDTIRLASKRFDATLRVPPFLAWPTTFENHENKEDVIQSKKKSFGVEEDEGLRIKLTLLAIYDRIYQAQTSRIHNSRSPRLIIYKSGPINVDISTRSCPKTLFHQVELHPQSTMDSDVGRIPFVLRDELTHLLLQNKDDSQKAKTSVPTNPGGSSLPLVENTQTAHKRVFAWQIAKLHVERHGLVSTLRELVSQFVSEFTDHELVQRCWGSIHTINKVFTRVCDESKNTLEKGASESLSMIWVIRDVPGDEYRNLHQLEPLSSGIHECPQCLKDKRYPDIDDALKHLRETHAHAWKATDEDTGTNLLHWLVSTSTLEQERKVEQLVEFAETIHECTSKLLNKSVDLRSSVASRDNTKSTRYLLPTALVKAAEKIFQYIYYTAHSVYTWQEKGTILTAPKNAPALLASYPNVTGAEYFAKVAEHALSNARDELMLMAHTGKSRNPLLHIRLTPESTILYALSCLVGRTFSASSRAPLSIANLYNEHLVHLRYEASRNPSKRILRELYLWKEELEVVELVAQQQQRAMSALNSVLGSVTFRIVTQARLDAHLDFEDPLIQKVKKGISNEYKVGLLMSLNEADKLAESLRHNIAIVEEGDSKAILIFTLVTIVFLPLSFVSSVFGMNTVDVRDMASTQKLFWVVALPVTAVVGGMSLLAAYGGSSRHISMRALKNLRFGIRLPIFRRKRSNDEEKRALASPMDKTRYTKIQSRGYGITLQPRRHRSISEDTSIV